MGRRIQGFPPSNVGPQTVLRTYKGTFLGLAFFCKPTGEKKCNKSKRSLK